MARRTVRSTTSTANTSPINGRADRQRQRPEAGLVSDVTGGGARRDNRDAGQHQRRAGHADTDADDEREPEQMQVLPQQAAAQHAAAGHRRRAGPPARSGGSARPRSGEQHRHRSRGPRPRPRRSGRAEGPSAGRRPGQPVELGGDRRLAEDLQASCGQPRGQVGRSFADRPTPRTAVGCCPTVLDVPLGRPHRVVEVEEHDLGDRPAAGMLSRRHHGELLRLLGQAGEDEVLRPDRRPRGWSRRRRPAGRRACRRTR